MHILFTAFRVKYIYYGNRVKKNLHNKIYEAITHRKHMGFKKRTADTYILLFESAPHIKPYTYGFYLRTIYYRTFKSSLYNNK